MSGEEKEAFKQYLEKFGENRTEGTQKGDFLCFPNGRCPHCKVSFLLVGTPQQEVTEKEVPCKWVLLLCNDMWEHGKLVEICRPPADVPLFFPSRAERTSAESMGVYLVDVQGGTVSGSREEFSNGDRPFSGETRRKRQWNGGLEGKFHIGLFNGSFDVTREKSRETINGFDFLGGPCLKCWLPESPFGLPC